MSFPARSTLPVRILLGVNQFTYRYRNWHYQSNAKALRANTSATFDCLKFTFEDAGERSNGDAEHLPAFLPTSPEGAATPSSAGRDVAVPVVTSPEVTAGPKRRSFTAQYQMQILAETDCAVDTSGRDGSNVGQQRQIVLAAVVALSHGSRLTTAPIYVQSAQCIGSAPPMMFDANLNTLDMVAGYGRLGFQQTRGRSLTANLPHISFCADERML